jgi:hypothetical protein
MPRQRNRKPDPIIRGFTRIQLIRDIRRSDEQGERLIPAGIRGIITAKDLGPGIYQAAMSGSVMLELTNDDFIITSHERGAHKRK